jgi:cell wall-associated NlpC family hydrolase
MASGCTPITARQARVREAGGAVRVPAAGADATVPELAARASSLPGTRRQVLESALAALDASEPGLDCSSFVVRVYAGSGIGLPRTVREQVRAGAAVAPAELRPGDLVFFAFARRPADHVGIYAGSGRFVHVAASTRRVQLADLATPPFASAWVASRRILPPIEPDA